MDALSPPVRRRCRAARPPRRALAAAAAAHAALRPQRRPHRQGARPHRARDAGLRRGLCRHRRRGSSCSRWCRKAISCGAAPRKDAVATARPDILDRNGLILATDVRAPSLFAEPRKIIDVDEAIELLTAVLPDLDATELRDRLSTAPRLRLAQARDHAAAAAGNPPARPARRRLPGRRTSASIRTAPRSRT